MVGVFFLVKHGSLVLSTIILFQLLYYLSTIILPKLICDMFICIYDWLGGRGGRSVYLYYYRTSIVLCITHEYAHKSSTTIFLFSLFFLFFFCYTRPNVSYIFTVLGIVNLHWRVKWNFSFFTSLREENRYVIDWQISATTLRRNCDRIIDDP